MIVPQTFYLILFTCCLLGIGAISWVPSKNGFPRNAVLGGYEKDGPVYVCRGKYKGFNVLGKAHIIKNRAYIPYYEKEYAIDEWEYLVGDCFYWAYGYDGIVPPNAIYDITGNDNKTVYVGRQYYRDMLIPGKISTELGLLYLPYYGKEYKFDKYEVLVKGNCQWSSV